MRRSIRQIDRMLFYLDTPPLDAFFRIVAGYLSFSLFCLWHGETGSDWGFVLMFVTILFSLRLAPAIVRHVFAFSPEVQVIWSQKRQLAKHYDSYQWRKLFWVGLGLAIHLIFNGRSLEYRVEWILAVTSLVGGAIGMMVWQYRTRADESLKAFLSR